MELINTFDDLVASVVQIQRKAEELVEKLHFINSDVHGSFGPPHLETIRETLAELQLDLPDLASTLPMDALKVFAAEVERLKQDT